MSNFLAIATVTAALHDLLQAAILGDVSGAGVTTLRPDGNGGLPGTGVNVFLYQVTPNPSWQNYDLPTRRPGGDLIQRPQAAIDLQYLLTCYGSDAQLEPQRVLGSVVRTLHARPVLTRAMIRQTIAKAAFSFLVNSNLADAVELVRFTPMPLTLEELSKLWSVYFQTPYNLSVAYQATVVLIESEESARAALPVRQRNLYVVPFRQSIVEDVRAADEDETIVPGSTLLIRGRQLRGDATELRIGEVTATPAPQDLTDTEIRIGLPAGLHPGVHGLQVVHPRLLGTPPVPHAGPESNLAPFVLHPVIQPPIGISTPVISADETRAADVTVKMLPNVGRTQRGVLLMNELAPPINRAARAYSFDAIPRKPEDPAETDTLVFPIRGVFAGEYLVRVQIDGAASPLESDADPEAPAFIGPKVTIA